ncbi:PRAME family member 12 [Lemmus lemmus]
MSSPPTLQKLAGKALLRNEALVISALKQMPNAFFPPLFKDAFTGKQTNIIRAMVAAWPFPCLPVGALMKTPNLKTLKAVLGGLDLLINQKDPPRCMESPLETLAITRCFLSNKDMSCLSQCPSIHKLKHLDLSGVTFFNLDHLLLGSLLERLTATLQTLQLKGCKIMDFQFSALLPALSQCTQLIEVNFMKNFLSVASLKKLLQHTAKLTLLSREIYPAPDEVYDDIGDVQPDRFNQHCSELMETMRAVRQPKEVYFVSKRCVDCRDFCVYNMGTVLCSCWQ